MSSMTIRGLEPELKKQLSIRAAHHGRSMEEEVRVILRSTLAEQEKEPTRIADSIHKRFARLGGVELDIPQREIPRHPPRFR